MGRVLLFPGEGKLAETDPEGEADTGAETRAVTARRLREEAHALLTESGLFQFLADRFDTPMVTGAASFDLMVWRHIEIGMGIDTDRWREWMSFAGDIAEQLVSVGLDLQQATCINGLVETAPGGGGAGLRWILRFKDFDGHPWRVDLWGWEPFDHAIRQSRDFTLKTDLGLVDRDLILRLKTEAHARPHYYGDIVTSDDIYDFCIARAGDSLEALEKWKAAH